MHESELRGQSRTFYELFLSRKPKRAPTKFYGAPVSVEARKAGPLAQETRSTLAIVIETVILLISLTTMSAFPKAVLNASFATASLSEDEEDSLMPWEEEGFVPRTSSGKQKSPNMIRSELQRYIDASSETKSAIVDRTGVNYNSFSKFMNPKNYKDQWSATQNGTY
jgi:hypothetical protein